jgi:hypothetical protein
MLQAISLNSQNRYEIKLYGRLDDSWLDWFGEAQAHAEVWDENDDSSEVTVFAGVVMDQAGLVGLMRRLHGLGVVLLSVRISRQVVQSG